MSDQQELVKAPELVLLEKIIQSAQEIDQSQLGRVYAPPMPQSSSYRLESVIHVQPNAPLQVIVRNRKTVRDFWLATPLFHKWVALGMFALILGALIGFITPWLTAIFEYLLW